MKRIIAALFVSLVALAGPGTGTSASRSGLDAFVTGLGEYSVPAPNDIQAQFGFLAISTPHGGAFGWFRHHGTVQGQTFDFTGRVTCLSTDPVNNRAWIGGVVTRNNSTHPLLTTPVHQVGRDIWFRVVDNGPVNSGVPDRTTFVGFETAEIPTSAFYCATMPWPDNDARTWAVTGIVKLFN
jgi:hypothetical protein